jgi:hypothetical protein
LGYEKKLRQDAGSAFETQQFVALCGIPQEERTPMAGLKIA